MVDSKMEDEEFKELLNSWKIKGIHDQNITNFVEKKQYLIGIAEKYKEQDLKQFAEDNELIKSNQGEFAYRMLEKFYQPPRDYEFNFYILYFRSEVLTRVWNTFQLSKKIKFDDFVNCVNEQLEKIEYANLTIDYRLYRPLNDNSVDDITSKKKNSDEWKMPDLKQVQSIPNESALRSIIAKGVHDIIICQNLDKYREKVAPSSWTENDLKQLGINIEETGNAQSIISTYSKNDAFKDTDIKQFHEDLKKANSKNLCTTAIIKYSKNISQNPTNEKLVDSFITLLLVQLKFFEKESILTLPQYPLNLEMSYKNSSCHCDFMIIDSKKKEKKEGLLLVAIIQGDKNLEKHKDESSNEKPGEAEVIAYGIAALQSMDENKSFKIMRSKNIRTFSDSGITYNPSTKKRKKEKKALNNDNSNNTDDNNDNKDNDDDNKDKNDKNAKEKPYLILIRVTGYYFTFYKMEKDENLLYRCWASQRNENRTKITSYRRGNPLNFTLESERAIIFQILVAIRDAFP